MSDTSPTNKTLPPSHLTKPTTPTNSNNLPSATYLPLKPPSPPNQPPRKPSSTDPPIPLPLPPEESASPTRRKPRAQKPRHATSQTNSIRTVDAAACLAQTASLAGHGHGYGSKANMDTDMSRDVRMDVDVITSKKMTKNPRSKRARLKHLRSRRAPVDDNAIGTPRSSSSSSDGSLMEVVGPNRSTAFAFAPALSPSTERFEKGRSVEHLHGLGDSSISRTTTMMEGEEDEEEGEWIPEFITDSVLSSHLSGEERDGHQLGTPTPTTQRLMLDILSFLHALQTKRSILSQLPSTTPSPSPTTPSSSLEQEKVEEKVQLTEVLAHNLFMAEYAFRDQIDEMRFPREKGKRKEGKEEYEAELSAALSELKSQAGELVERYDAQMGILGFTFEGDWRK